MAFGFRLSVFKIPHAALFPSIPFFCCIGTFSTSNNLDDIDVTAAFGLMGCSYMRLGLEAAPLMPGFILGPMLDENFRHAMLFSRGSLSTFVNRPISGSLVTRVAACFAWQLHGFARRALRSCEQRAGQAALARAEPAA
jgi:TctA family transporter